MLDPEYLYNIADGAIEVVNQMETEVLVTIIDRVLARRRRGSKYIFTASDKWAMETLQEAGMLLQEISEIIAKYTGLTMDEIADAMFDAGVTTLQYDERTYMEAGLDVIDESDVNSAVAAGRQIRTYTNPISDEGSTSLDAQTQPEMLYDKYIRNHAKKMMRQSPYIRRTFERMYKATGGSFYNMTRSMAFSGMMKYVQAVDKAYTETVTGAKGYTQAVADAAEQIAKEGVNLVNAAGRNESIETATLRNVRTGVSQTAAEITLERMKEMDVKLIIVSSHLGARYGDGGQNPGNHFWWQGRVYSLDDPDGKYPDFRTTTGYGTGEGLCGWNCRHHFGPFYEGMENPHQKFSFEDNKKMYDLSQQQRKMERNIRKTKSSIEGMKAIVNGLPDGIQKENAQSVLDALRTRTNDMVKNYETFCKNNGLRPLYERLEIARRRYASNKKLIEQKE